MYIKVKDRELFKELENNLTIPNKWNKFIEDIKNKAKLIIKNKTDYECTLCHHKFNSDVKVNRYCKCPNCNKNDNKIYYPLSNGAFSGSILTPSLATYILYHKNSPSITNQ